jgi:hypothetical protein
MTDSKERRRSYCGSSSTFSVISKSYGSLMLDARSVLAYCEMRRTKHVLPHRSRYAPSSSPGIVVANTNSVGASLCVWLASGLLGWTGASSFAELGSAIPLNGGAQAYLSYSYGPLVSFLFAWTAIIALKPGTSLPVEEPTSH